MSKIACMPLLFLIAVAGLMVWAGYVLAAALVVLTAGDGRPIAINPQQIVVIRGPSQKDLLTRNVRCVLGTADGKFISVIEDCDTVRHKLVGP